MTTFRPRKSKSGPIVAGFSASPLNSNSPEFFCRYSSIIIIIIIIINHLLISNAHITQEWQLIVNTAMTENQRFF